MIRSRSSTRSCLYTCGPCATGHRSKPKEIAARRLVWNRINTVYSGIPSDDKEAVQRRHDRWEPWPHTVSQSRSIPKIDSPKPCLAALDLRRHAAQARQ
jgi:hypothetical protein